MQDLISLFQDIWPGLLALLVSAGVVSLLLQKFKVWFSLQTDRIIWLIGAMITGTGVLFEAVLSSDPSSWGSLGVRFAAVMSALQPVYVYAIKPASKFVTEVKEMRTQKLAGAVVTPTASADVVPVATIDAIAPVPQEDFN